MSVLNDYEFFRDGIGLLPVPSSTPKGSAIWIHSHQDTGPVRSCVCDECKSSRRKKTCAALRTLGEGVRVYQQAFVGGWQRYFESTVWFQLAKAIYAGSQLACEDVRVQQVEQGVEGAAAIRFLDTRGHEVLRLLDISPSGRTLLERTGKVPRGEFYINRSSVIERLRLFQLTDQERAFEKAGMRSQRQAWDGSFWSRWAYHCVRELADEQGKTLGTFHPAVDKGTGDFTLTHRLEPDFDTFKVTLPRTRVAAVLKLLARQYPDQEDLQIHPVPLRSLFRISGETELDLRVRPVIRLLQESGEEKYLDREEFKKFQYGNLVYIRELGLLAELEKERKHRKFATPKAMKLARSQVPSFLDDYVEAIQDGSLVLEEPLRGLKIHKTYDRVEVDGVPVVGEPSWYWLSVKYGFGDETVTLADILRARRKGAPYLETSKGWIDLKATVFDDLAHLEDKTFEDKTFEDKTVEGKTVEGRIVEEGDDDGGDDSGQRIRMSVGDLLRFQARAEQPLQVVTQQSKSDWLRRLLDRQPPAPYQAPEGFRSELRDYQRAGVDWLRFLGEQNLGGLLCDDMGLGKTHQSMAFMACLAADDRSKGPFLVVSPTSVMSHWRDKLRRFAPKLKPNVYHGTDRSLGRRLDRRHVILTSYGVLRNDAQELNQVPWSAVIFDEIQYLKNRETLAYAAASQLSVPIKIGLTGTPIENSLEELKNLFNLVMPGYFGDDEALFKGLESHAVDGGLRQDRRLLDRLRRLIHPFILRRLKSSVLDELPEKIEDVRSCELSPEQVALYRQAIEGRGRKLVAQLEDQAGALPYMHVFALLNLLKQICDHPAIVEGDLDFEAHSSGKWDLYCEILRESLDAGEKVVVFSQYLKMLEMMSRHLTAQDIDHVRLVGSTAAKDRGALIERFNTDPECRVFLGSLKAGGTGIDLVGGSVVIHYDRWWNAAREDQATDRVHRMGQKRVVQVFKLVTEGTLEEKIAGMIENKRDLLDEVVREDDARLTKLFSREDLLELLQEV